MASRSPEKDPRGPQENPAAVKMTALVLDSRAALLGPSGNRLGALLGPSWGPPWTLLGPKEGSKRALRWRQEAPSQADGPGECDCRVRAPTGL